MVDEDKYCIDILTQVSAATKALETVALSLLSDHLSHCVAEAARAGGDEAEDGGQADLAALRQRLELTQLAVQTGAPLSTSEVSQLLGARPSSETVERGGLKARRLSRNVWKLSLAEDASSRSDDAFRRRF